MSPSRTLQPSSTGRQHLDEMAACAGEFAPTGDASRRDLEVEAMKYLSADEARQFAQQWLPAWSGNQPELLASFYADDALYLDPAVPNGVKGKPELLAYFRRLLRHNPDWVWSQIEGIPLEDGFLNKWRAQIPVGAKTIEIVGVCFVQLDDAGKIRRNEVYFDRTPWLAELERQRAGDQG
jgi:SnoaL-like domain